MRMTRRMALGGIAAAATIVLTAGPGNEISVKQQPLPVMPEELRQLFEEK